MVVQIIPDRADYVNHLNKFEAANQKNIKGKEVSRAMQSTERAQGLTTAVLSVLAYYLVGAAAQNGCAGALLCTILQPAVPVWLAGRAHIKFGVCRPQKGAMAPAAAFILLAVCATLVFPAQTLALPKDKAELFWTLARVCAAVPITEELVFRGVIQHALPLDRTGKIMLQALLFAVMHSGVTAVLYAFLMGIILGWMTQRTKSIWPCVVLHGLNNLITCGMAI